MSPLPADHPMLVAFNAWIDSEDGKNAVAWSVYDQHRRGALWAAFVAAWNSRAPVEITEEMAKRALRKWREIPCDACVPDDDVDDMRAALAAALNYP